MHAFGGFQGEMFKTFLQYTIGKSILLVSNAVKHPTYRHLSFTDSSSKCIFIVVSATDNLSWADMFPAPEVST